MSDSGVAFHRYISDLLELTGGHLPDGLTGQEWEIAARKAAVAGLPREGPWPEAVSGAVIRVILNDPFPVEYNPLLKLALEAAGRRRVQEGLIAGLENGTSAEKVAAVGAWYRARPPLVYRGLASLLDGGEGVPTEESKREYDAVEDLRIRWRQATLREFVANEDPDVRRALREEISLDPARYPAGFADLVAEAARIARTC